MVALTLACAPVASAHVSPKIVGGGDASITDFPYQVALFNPIGTPAQTQFCGGVVYDSTHVLTAAHCVVNLPNPDLEPTNDIAVFAGAADLSDTSGLTSRAAALAIDSQYDPATNDYDIAMVTLATPLWTPEDTPPANIQPIVPITADQLTMVMTDDPLPDATVSGWGCEDAVPAGSDSCATFPDHLQSVDVQLVSNTDCSTAYAPDTLITARMFCAASPGKDSCFGDSGGPITLNDTATDDTKVLAGLVDAGNGCAAPGFPGIYTSVAELDGFINDPDPATMSAPPTLSGTPQVGQTLTCAPGTWTNTTQPFQYRFMRDRGGSISALTDYSTTDTYTVTAAAGGNNVFCLVEATGANAIRGAQTTEVSVPAPPVTPPPPTTPTPPVIPAAPKDTSPPKLHVSRKTCTKTSCTIKLTVRDASPSSGLGKLKATLNYSRMVSCRKHGKRTKCTKHLHRALSAKAGKRGTFTIVIRRLTPGKGYTLTLIPFDRAGNRPEFSTITSIRTKPRHQSLLG